MSRCVPRLRSNSEANPVHAWLFVMILFNSYYLAVPHLGY